MSAATQNEPLPPDYQKIAEKVKSGEYFHEARLMYDDAVHDPMVERYWYLLITVLSAVILFIALGALQSLYPLKTPVPFIYSTQDIVEDLPRINSLVVNKGEAPGEAMLRFLAGNYVSFRESYDIETFDRNINGIRSQSTQEVFDAFQRAIDTRNPESPITLYQRHSKRSITIVSFQRRSETEADVVFEALVSGRGPAKKSRWQANIAFSYSGIALDDETGKVKPLSFIVTGYNVKRL